MDRWRNTLLNTTNHLYHRMVYTSNQLQVFLKAMGVYRWLSFKPTNRPATQSRHLRVTHHQLLIMATEIDSGWYCNGGWQRLLVMRRHSWSQPTLVWTLVSQVMSPNPFANTKCFWTGERVEGTPLGTAPQCVPTCKNSTVVEPCYDFHQDSREKASGKMGIVMVVRFLFLLSSSYCFRCCFCSCCWWCKQTWGCFFASKHFDAKASHAHFRHTCLTQHDPAVFCLKMSILFYMAVPWILKLCLQEGLWIWMGGFFQITFDGFLK